MSFAEPPENPASLRTAALDIFADALGNCSVEQAFRGAFVVESERSCTVNFNEAERIDFACIARVLVLAMGKAATTMTHALLQGLPLPAGVEVQGILIAPAAPSPLPLGFRSFQGGHPLPNAQSLEAARAALSLLKEAAADPRAGETICFFLVSGGASAMTELPLEPSIVLEDTVAFHRALVHCGASITEINCVRKHFSAVKGGRLAQALGAVRSLTLAVSDVPAEHLHALASGPTVPDPSTVEDCRRVLDRYDLLRQFPPPVAEFFRSPALPETPKPGAFRASLHALLSSEDLAEAARQRAVSLRYVAVVDNTCDDWEVSAAAAYLVERLRALRLQYGCVCLISVGEVTVRVPETAPHGTGGRNTHFALTSALMLRPGENTVVLSVGSDGVDGNSPAAGAVIDASLVTDCAAEAREALDRFDAYTFLHGRGCTVVTGPSGHNIRDLRLLLAAPSGGSAP